MLKSLVGVLLVKRSFTEQGTERGLRACFNADKQSFLRSRQSTGTLAANPVTTLRHFEGDDDQYVSLWVLTDTHSGRQ